MHMSTASVTAKVCAYLRGIDAIRQDRIFNDYLALELLSNSEHEEIAQLTKDYRGTPVLQAMQSVPLSRSTWAEGHLQCFAQGKRQVQYLILGAGLDTFAWRNQNTRIRVFEIDHPATQQYKQERIANLQWHANSQIIFAGVNFEQDSLQERLQASGLDPYLPTLISILGVSYYLPFTAFASTLQALSTLLKGPTRLLFDYQQAGFERLLGPQMLAAFTKSLGESMAEGYEYSALIGLLSTLGWTHFEHLAPFDIDRIYFKKRHDHLHAFESVHLLAATRSSVTYSHNA